MIDIEQYGYDLPQELIRREGVEPRDSTRLFVYDTATNQVTHTTFRNIALFLPKKSLLVLNDTRVVPARLWLTKETGGKIEVFVLANEFTPERGHGQTSHSEIPVLVDRKCLPGWKLFFPSGEYFEVLRQEENKFFVTFRGGERSLVDLLHTYGETPVPHYLEGGRYDETELRNRYQSIFASSGASVAAPTASLHFTETVFDSLDTRGIDRACVTLDVGRGTFAPLTSEHWRSGRLHAERYGISSGSAQAINDTKDQSRMVIAVGTTALRTIESAVHDGRIVAGQGITDIFIYSPYRFQIADGLITNFHLPKTSLMLLVDAFLEHRGARRRIMDLYAEAIQERYAFYSFGDSMLIL